MINSQLVLLRSINTILKIKYKYTDETLMKYWRDEKHSKFKPTPLEYARDNKLGLMDVLDDVRGEDRGQQDED